MDVRIERLVLDYLIGSWSDHLNGVPTNQHIQILGTEALVDQTRMLVLSELVTPEDRVPVDWTVAHTPSGRWVVVDVAVEGVSVVRTMKSDFTAIIRANGGQLEPLMAALRQKIASYRKTGG